MAKYCETATAARECGMACCSSPEAAWLGLRLGLGLGLTLTLTLTRGRLAPLEEVLLGVELRGVDS